MTNFHLLIRTYRRLPVQSSGYFHNEHIQDIDALYNLSLDGCRMDVNLPLHAGTVVELMLLLGPRGALHMKGATVCWTRGLECGTGFERCYV